jgi:hypothetical protein
LDFGQNEHQLKKAHRAILLMPEVLDNLKMGRQDVDGEIRCITWSAADMVLPATYTFIARDGKIMVRAFAAYMPRLSMKSCSRDVGATLMLHMT